MEPKTTPETASVSEKKQSAEKEPPEPTAETPQKLFRCKPQPPHDYRQWGNLLKRLSTKIKNPPT